MKTLLRYFLSLMALALLASPVMAATPEPSHISAPDEFRVLSGDVLQISVWKEESLDKEVVVLPDGKIDFPLIGTVEVKGRTPREIQDMVKKKLSKFIPDATVSVMVKAPLGHTVNVIGQVGKPGEIVLSRQMTVLEALSQVGGLTPYADTSRIVVLRYINGQKTSLDYPYNDISRGRSLEKNLDLKAGDVIVVPTGGLF